MTKPGRVMCCVPFCNRSCKGGRYVEFLCSVHWPRTSKRWRRLFFKVRRKIERLPVDRRAHLIALEQRIWERLKDQAMQP